MFCKCLAKLYVHGVLQRDAVACIYLGKDGRSPGSLVRVIGGKRRGKEIRTAQIVSFDIDTFPYSNQLVPRPDDLAVVEYSDDTGSEEEEHVMVDGDGQEMSDESSSDDNSDSDDEPDTLARYLRDPNLPVCRRWRQQLLHQQRQRRLIR